MTRARLGCRRSTDDPLLRLFIDRYHLHLLAVPRQGSAVGDLYVEQRGVVGTPGYIGGILTPGFELPPYRTGERLADIAGQLTRDVNAKAGARIADELLGALGIAASAGISAAISRAAGIQFRFHEVFRASVDVLALGRALAGHSLLPGHPAISARARYYLATSVLTTDAVSIVASGASGLGLEETAGASLAGAAASWSVQGSNEIVLRSTVPLAFAVELYELQFSAQSGAVQLRKTSVPVRIRGGQQTIMRERLVPARIGGDDGDLFL